MRLRATAAHQGAHRFHRAALDAAPEAKAAYESLVDSAKKQYLWWISSAKRPATRASRIAETIRRLS